MNSQDKASDSHTDAPLSTAPASSFEGPLFPNPENPRKWGLPAVFGGTWYVRYGGAKYVGVVEGGDLWVATARHGEAHFFYVRDNIINLVFVWDNLERVQHNDDLFQAVDPAPEPVIDFITAYCRLAL